MTDREQRKDRFRDRLSEYIDGHLGVEEEVLREHLARELVRYKIPRSFEFVDEPLRDDAGKVRRAALREARVAGPAGPGGADA